VEESAEREIKGRDWKLITSQTLKGRTNRDDDRGVTSTCERQDRETERTSIGIGQPRAYEIRRHCNTPHECGKSAVLKRFNRKDAKFRVSDF